MFMSTTTRAAKNLQSAIMGILLVSLNLAAQSPNVQQITLPDAQAQGGTDKAAHLAALGAKAAKLHREAAQADYLPKIDSTFTNLHFNKFLGQTFELARRTAELPLLSKDLTIAAFTLTQPVTPLFKVHEAVEIAQADETVAKAKARLMGAQIAATIDEMYFSLLIAQRQ